MKFDYSFGVKKLEQFFCLKYFAVALFRKDGQDCKTPKIS